jgi:hypothetical protein
MMGCKTLDHFERDAVSVFPPASLRFGRRVIRGRGFGHRGRIARRESLLKRLVESGIDLVLHRLTFGFPGHYDVSSRSSGHESRAEV